jgi:uncharacterized protein (TIGR00369 family)
VSIQGDKPSRRQRHKASPIPFPVVVPFVESLGIELHAYTEGRVELRVDLDEAHLNAWEVAHGGVLMSMMDVGMAMAARSATGHGGGVATIEMKTSFMRPAQHQLRAEATLLHRTATLAFCEAAVYDDAGKLCATATGTFKYLRGLVKRPAAGSHPSQPKDDTP